MVRVKGSGNFIRAFTIPFAVIVGLSSIGYLGNGATQPAGADPWSSISIVIAVMFLVASVAAGVRVVFLGVWLDDSRLVARSWFRTTRLERFEVARCSTEVYSGLLWSDDVFGWNRMLVLVLNNGAEIDLRGTLTWSKSASRQAELITAWADGSTSRDSFTEAAKKPK